MTCERLRACVTTHQQQRGDTHRGGLHSTILKLFECGRWRLGSFDEFEFALRAIHALRFGRHDCCPSQLRCREYFSTIEAGEQKREWKCVSQRQAVKVRRPHFKSRVASELQISPEQIRADNKYDFGAFIF